MSTSANTKLKKTANLLREAIPRMSQLNIPLTPENYHVWYEYTMGDNPELSRTIDSMLSKGEKFTAKLNQELYSTYIQLSPEKLLKDFKDDIQKLVSQLLQKIQSVETSTQKYSSSLDKYHRILQEDPDIDIVTSLITDLIDETETALLTNQSMEIMLESMSEEVDMLRENLQTATITAYTDKLTGIPNRRDFDEKIELLCDVYQDENSIFSLLLIDIDHFKQFNDTHGHDVGDKVLRYVAHILTGGIKGDDTVARYGGEEFVVLLPHTDYEGAMAVGSNLREKIAGRNLIDTSDENKSYGHVTISIGAAAISAEDDSNSIIKRADKALYLAKQSGRNKVCGERDLQPIGKH
jgi:diguanylate cyclase